MSAPALALMLSGSKARSQENKQLSVMTVNGPMPATQMGTSLIHEHILVDFIGANVITPDRWDRDEVMDKMLPYLDEAVAAGCKTFVDCTPNYLGRDVELLRNISRTARINIITNTGYYGGSDEKFLPAHAFEESADKLANRWGAEYKFGIDKTGIKPGFIKISVNNASLSEMSKKLVSAAAITHIRTGLTIASHTGPYAPALEQIQILKKSKVNPSAFIWVHAQTEKDRASYVAAAKEGAWISLDGLNDSNVKEYTELILFMNKEKVLDRVLVSHDAGWYEPGKPGGGDVRGYTTLFKKLIPELETSGMADAEIKKIIQTNPMNAFSIAVRRMK